MSSDYYQSPSATAKHLILTVNWKFLLLFSIFPQKMFRKNNSKRIFLLQIDACNPLTEHNLFFKNVFLSLIVLYSDPKEALK